MVFIIENYLGSICQPANLPIHAMFLFRKLRIGLHFANLAEMPFVVRGGEQQPLVQRRADRAVSHQHGPQIIGRLLRVGEGVRAPALVYAAATFSRGPRRCFG